MAGRPLYSARAESDLREIYRDSLRLFGRQQARQYSGRLRTLCEKLAEGYTRGRPFDETRAGYLRKLVGAHYIVYRFGDEGRMYVVRILHSRMNLPDHL
ncbi:type II toxin-antitoxin system RelE/ParE family toxin [Aurantimonas sp. VKM B-3413]|uniref:type II toxin-antitoxin system RelE/ParE family toxin n=1 Tax=Aurantimonas sp. VKM B-3413 TaxID=2779401 RepID=UPI001E408C74|nr:type II toxin-antitoxin system RelE/ParE family toxin [Aurantimonas sp. VKM B-3413]MCB8839199.1 type II toxin-antitoxin system RelE/ParE family toxin [Aurantimonas sp. VKM B-3413]